MESDSMRVLESRFVISKDKDDEVAVLVQSSAEFDWDVDLEVWIS
jgi:hypothetical protein